MTSFRPIQKLGITFKVSSNYCDHVLCIWKSVVSQQVLSTPPVGNLISLSSPHAIWIDQDKLIFGFNCTGTCRCKSSTSHLSSILLKTVYVTAPILSMSSDMTPELIVPLIWITLISLGNISHMLLRRHSKSYYSWSLQVPFTCAGLSFNLLPSSPLIPPSSISFPSFLSPHPSRALCASCCAFSLSPNCCFCEQGDTHVPTV